MLISIFLILNSSLQLYDLGPLEEFGMHIFSPSLPHIPSLRDHSGGLRVPYEVHYLSGPTYFFLSF